MVGVTGLASPPLRSSPLATGIPKSAFRLWSHQLPAGPYPPPVTNTPKPAIKAGFVYLVGVTGFGPATSTSRKGKNQV